MTSKVDSFGTSYTLNKINEKDPIVFIHGVGLTKEIWDPQINFLKIIILLHTICWVMEKHL